MKQIVVIIMLFSILIVACSSQNQAMPNDKVMDGQGEQMMDKRQQLSFTACLSKAYGDSCTYLSAEGEMKGTCQIADTNLFCKI